MADPAQACFDEAHETYDAAIANCPSQESVDAQAAAITTQLEADILVIEQTLAIEVAKSEQIRDNNIANDSGDQRAVKIDAAELAMLLNGIDIQSARRRKRFRKTD